MMNLAIDSSSEKRKSDSLIQEGLRFPFQSIL